MSRLASRASLLVLGLAALTAFLAPPPAQANGEWPPVLQRYCEQTFDTAQRIDMESFRDYDAQTFRDIHTEDAVTIFASGAYRIGIDAIMAALASHFANREAVWEWTELHREVKGCDTAFIIYDTTYSIPSIGYRARARIGVTYTFEHGRWLALFDQSTPLPPAP
jgi:ketosteroid isomerase-like protein